MDQSPSESAKAAEPITRSSGDAIIHDGYRYVSAEHLRCCLYWRWLYETEVARATHEISKRIATVNDFEERARIIDEMQRAFGPIQQYYMRQLTKLMMMAMPVTYWSGAIPKPQVVG